MVAWGVTDWPESPDHHLKMSLNGIPVADQTFDGLIEKTFKFSLPSGSLHEGHEYPSNDTSWRYGSAI